MAAARGNRDPDGTRRYRSDLLMDLSRLIYLWESPQFQSEVLTQSGEPLDQSSHQLLRLLGFSGPLRPSQIAERLKTGASNVSKMLHRLEANGWLERKPDSADARATLVGLTPAGIEAAQHVFDLGDDMIAQVLTGWNPRDVEQYTRLTRRFVDDAHVAAAVMRARGLSRTWSADHSPS
ncbi:MarR family winged helix-turn-helix transcriptional regulator [Pseudarthrobacter sp. 1G09]|uniref:MarR family winged helix-turn-helix transcriptional regulator n=1 Tax=Pseudarthrobacter sp. 1G09 TaxID=3416178 RepID=UPI003CEBE01C